MSAVVLPALLLPQTATSPIFSLTVFICPPCQCLPVFVCKYRCCAERACPPRAGFNCAEAVNFGPPDWLPFGSDRAHKYRDDAKPLTLSHDALLVTLVGY